MKKKIITSIILFSTALVLVLGATVLCLFIIHKQFNDLFVNNLVPSLIVEGIVFLLGLSVRIAHIILKTVPNIRDYNYNSSYRNKRVRLSFAYLIRIRVNNRYLLVKSGHDRNIYGPVGGVYHINHNEYVYNKLGFARDDSPGDSEDVRGRILGKNISKFIKWFNKGIDRETCPDREFREELIESDIAPNELFSNAHFRFIVSKYRGINYDDYYKTDELCRFDIFELVLTKEQEEYFSSLKSKGRIMLATSDEIKTGGIDKNNDRRTIGTQTVYILED